MDKVNDMLDSILDRLKESNEKLSEQNKRLKDICEQTKGFRENHPERKSYTDRFINKQELIDWLQDTPFEWISYRYITENAFRLSHETVIDELKEDQNETEY